MALPQDLGNSSTHFPVGPSNSSTYVRDCGSAGNASISDGTISTVSSANDGGGSGGGGSGSGSSGGGGGGGGGSSLDHSLVSLFHCIIRISVLCSFICVSLLSNSMLLLVFRRKPPLLQVANRFILNLLIADLLQTAVVMPWVVAGSLPSFWPLSDHLCTAMVTLMHLFAYASINTIVLVSVDRYLSIIYPLSYPNKMTTLWGAMFILATWLVSLIQSTPPAFGWGDIGFDRDSSLCLILWNSSASYTALNILLSFLFPGAILVACYGMVFRAARRQNALVHPMRPRIPEPVESSTVVVEQGSDVEEEDDVDRKDPKPSFHMIPRRRLFKPSPYHCKAARVIFVIITSFILCMGPYCVLAIVSSVVGPAHPWVNTWVFLLFFLQCCLHPYTYGYMHKSIKKELAFLLLRLFCRGPIGQNSSMDNNFPMADSRTFHSHYSVASAWKA